MPYFNPNKVDFNYNTNTIDAVGATGRALWDIYQDSVRNSFTKQKLAEENRSNLASEQNNIDRLNENIRHNMTTEQEVANNNNILQGFRRDELGLKGQELGLKASKYQNDAAYNNMMANIALQNANTARQNSNINATRLDYDMRRGQNDLDSKALETNLAFEKLGASLPAELKDASPEQIQAYKRAVINVETNKALSGGVNGSLVDRKQLAQKSVQNLSDMQTLIDSLKRAKEKYNSTSTGWLDTALHNGAKYIALDSKGMNDFQSALNNALLFAKGTFGDGKMSNLQYQQLVNSFPTGNETSDDKFISNYDATLDALSSYYKNTIEQMKNGGVDMREFQNMLPTIEKSINELYFVPRTAQEPQTPQEARSLKSERNNTQKNYVDANALGINFR
nr:hypothetical protein [uncultured Campylobacter sp.]